MISVAISFSVMLSFRLAGTYSYVHFFKVISILFFNYGEDSKRKFGLFTPISKPFAALQILGSYLQENSKDLMKETLLRYATARKKYLFA